jgi:hypothetical protein
VGSSVTLIRAVHATSTPGSSDALISSLKITTIERGSSVALARAVQDSDHGKFKETN